MGRSMGCIRTLTPQKSNELIPKIAIFKGSYLFQSIILGIHVSFRECRYSCQVFLMKCVEICIHGNLRASTPQGNIDRALLKDYYPPGSLN